MIGYCVCGQTVCECKRINCRYIHMYILISYIIAFVLYTFKETSLYGNTCSGALLQLSYHCHKPSQFKIFKKIIVRNSKPLKIGTKKAWDLSSACTNLDHCEHFELYLNISSIMFFTLILCNIFIFFPFVLIAKKLIAIQNKTFNTHLISVLQYSIKLCTLSKNA